MGREKAGPGEGELDLPGPGEIMHNRGAIVSHRLDQRVAVVHDLSSQLAVKFRPICFALPYAPFS